MMHSIHISYTKFEISQIVFEVSYYWGQQAKVSPMFPIAWRSFKRLAFGET